ncbi:MAG: magnesium chelatase subunit D [Myxococcota bacterium]
MSQASASRSEANGSERWCDACLAARLFAMDPFRCGGIVLRARSGPVRARWLDYLRGCLGDNVGILRLPLSVTEDRLLGGLDLAATLSAGRVVAEKGVLASAHRSVLLATMAERLAARTVAHICAVLDRGELVSERDGMTLSDPAELAIVALDEGIDEEAVAPSLADRLAIHLDLTDVAPHCASDVPRVAVRHAIDVVVDQEAVTALCGTALALGIRSIRAPMLALSVARLAAADRSSTQVEPEDVEAALRLVLVPRATQLPATEATEQEEGPPEQEQVESDSPVSSAPMSEQTLEDRVLEAARAALPPGLLDELNKGVSVRRSAAPGVAGPRQRSLFRGRRIGTRRGELRGGARLSVLDTLRSAAPWQKLRHARQSANSERRISIRPDDFRVYRYQNHAETVAIFAVDASGSAALARLAEAKGAVEYLLADCYSRRDQVALIAFRGSSAEVILPPTRALVRAKRAIGALPGGGGTPLAVGIDAAVTLARDVRRRGQFASVVLMTDGRANVSRDGSPGRERAHQDALVSSRVLARERIPTLFVDTATRSQPKARELAEAAFARYLHLPYSDVAQLSNQVRELGEQEDRARAF